MNGIPVRISPEAVAKAKRGLKKSPFKFLSDYISNLIINSK